MTWSLFYTQFRESLLILTRHCMSKVIVEFLTATHVSNESQSGGEEKWYWEGITYLSLELIPFIYLNFRFNCFYSIISIKITTFLYSFCFIFLIQHSYYSHFKKMNGMIFALKNYWLLDRFAICSILFCQCLCLLNSKILKIFF